ncbi:MAG: hypothetical protein COA56_12275 [Dehalococcoidia bacterium]|nr:MAG: hypothetical protein COA56_12275 [Dehalococcoidia bacterium]
MDLALVVLGQDHRVLSHISVEEVVHLGDQAIVPDHQPGPSEDLLQLFLVDIGVRKYTRVEFPRLEVNHVVFFVGNGHDCS